MYVKLFNKIFKYGVGLGFIYRWFFSGNWGIIDGKFKFVYKVIIFFFGLIYVVYFFRLLLFLSNFFLVFKILRYNSLLYGKEKINIILLIKYIIIKYKLNL